MYSRLINARNIMVKIKQILVVITSVVKIKQFLVVITTVVKITQFLVVIETAVKIKQFLVVINTVLKIKQFLVINNYGGSNKTVFGGYQYDVARYECVYHRNSTDFKDKKKRPTVGTKSGRSLINRPGKQRPNFTTYELHTVVIKSKTDVLELTMTSLHDEQKK